MSLKQNEEYNEYMSELECKYCNQNITIKTENREDQMGQGYEYEVEHGHEFLCRYYLATVGERDAIDQRIDAPMPPIKIYWTAEDNKAQLEYQKQKYADENWR